MMSDDWKEPEINPCRGCDDYDGCGGCKSHGGCGARPKGKWIPVTEQKPKVEQLVWLYTKDNAEPYNEFVGYLNEDYWWVECGVNYSEYSPSCIVAWQPLNKPEPYNPYNCGAKMEVEE